MSSIQDPRASRTTATACSCRPLQTGIDAAAVSDLVRSVEGPVLLVGHSYGGAVITNVDPGAGEIAGLVYVAAFEQDELRREYDRDLWLGLENTYPFTESPLRRVELLRTDDGAVVDLRQ